MSIMVMLAAGLISTVNLELSWIMQFQLRLAEIRRLVHDRVVLPDTPSARSNSGLALALVKTENVAQETSTIKIDKFDEALSFGLRGNINQIRVMLKNSEESTIISNAALLGLLWGEHFDIAKEFISNELQSDWLKPAINSAYLGSIQHGFEKSARFIQTNFDMLIERSVSRSGLIQRYESEMRMNRSVGRNWRRFFAGVLAEKNDNSQEIKSAQLMVQSLLEAHGRQPFNAIAAVESLGELASRDEFAAFEPIVAWLECRYGDSQAWVLDIERLDSLSQEEFELGFLVYLEKSPNDAILLVDKMTIKQLAAAQEFFAVYCDENNISDEKIVQICSKISNLSYRLAMLCGTVQPFP